MTDTEKPYAHVAGCRELLGFDLPAPKYRYNQTAWIYVDPRNLNDPTEVPVFAAKVTTVELKAVASHGEKPLVSIRYQLTLCDSMDDVWRDESGVFLRETEAQQAALGCVLELAAKAKAKSDALAKVVAALKIVPLKSPQSEGDE